MEERIRRRELAMRPPEPTEEEKQYMALLTTANQFFRRFQLDSATVYFQKALEMRPGNEEIIGTLAAIENAREVQRQQEAALRAAREDVAQTINSFLSQAESLYASHNYRAAHDLLALIFDVDPGNPGARDLADRIETAKSMEIVQKFDEARVAVEEGRLIDAVEAYNRILEIDPNNQGAMKSKRQVLATMDIPERLRLGVELFNQGELNEARKRFEAILEINPDEPVAKDYLQRIRDAQKEEAKESTFEDLQNDPVYWDLYLEGLRHMRNKEYQKAIDAWEKVLKAYPNNQNTLNNIEQARLRLQSQNSGN
jgi:tetratricopeptide (TPR) repeat protein